MIVGRVLVFPGERLLITNKNNLMDLQCSVVSTMAKGGGEVQLAVSFDTPSSYFWNNEQLGEPNSLSANESVPD